MQAHPNASVLLHRLPTEKRCRTKDLCDCHGQLALKFVILHLNIKILKTIVREKTLLHF